MKLVSTFDYRNARSIIRARYPNTLESIESLLSDPKRKLDLATKQGAKQRGLSSQLQKMFLDLGKGWQKEQPCLSAEGLKYDLTQSDLPVEIEIGHQRVVYADFFKFMADHSNGQIHAALMIVTDDPNAFGHDWHCSLESTKRKIESISRIYLVPTLLLGISP